jgi:hypothetical protein
VGRLWSAAVGEIQGFCSLILGRGHGRPDGANIGVPTQNRYKVGLACPAVINLSDEPIQPKANSRGGVLHSLRVFQHPEALVGILHDDFPVGIRGNWK